MTAAADTRRNEVEAAEKADDRAAEETGDRTDARTQMTTDRDAADQAGKRPVVMLVDGFGLIFRAYYAIQNGLTTSSGQQVAAVFGFATMLLETLRVHKPDHAVVALEGGRTFRHDASEAYKANRPDMPPEFQQQVDVIKGLLNALNIPVMVREGYEADDVIGSLSTHLATQDHAEVLIVTGDSDLLQLVDDHVTVVLPGRQSFSDLRTFDREAVIERFGVGPELVPDYKAIVGDTSDNVAGVKGIGDKGARALLQQFGAIEGIIAHLPEITPERTRKAMEAGQQDAIESKKIVTIVRDLDVKLDWAHSAVGNYDRGRVVDLFRELEFRTLVGKLPEVEAKAAEVEMPTFDPVRTIVRSRAQLDALVGRMAETGRIALDLETTATNPMLAELVGIAIAVDPEESYYIPLAHRTITDKDQLGADEVRDVLSPALSAEGLKVVAHHGKYDLQVLSRHGYPLIPLAFDTMIAAYLLGESSIRLKDLAFTRLGINMTEITALIGTGKKQLTMDQVDGEEAGAYACGDVEATLALADTLAPEVTERGQDDLLFGEEQPLVPVLIAMERTGIAVDTAYLAELSTELTRRLADLEVAITEAAGHPVNIGSNKQLGDLLFTELALPAGRRTKTGFSVDADELERLRGKHPIVELILEHRSLQKLKSTYVDSLGAEVHPQTGRVHTSFNQTIAATGRLSSTNPNLQNIPVRSEDGRRVRHAFIADRRPEHRLFEDAVLLSADYSQIELRLLAHMSGEPFLVEAFRNGDDIHRATAAAVYGIDQSEVSSEQRRVAKTVNFGVMYGHAGVRSRRDSGLSNADAGEFIKQYWARLPLVRKLFDRTIEQGVRDGYVSAPSGRRRYLPDLTSSNGMRRMGAERMAVNMPVQGTAADIIKVAMIRLHAALADSPLRARLLLQVHDELVLEVERADLDATAVLVLATMEGAAELSVPLEAEVSVGPRWDEMSPLEPRKPSPEADPPQDEEPGLSVRPFALHYDVLPGHDRRRPGHPVPPLDLPRRCRSMPAGDGVPMPTYAYRCRDCGHQFDIFQKFSEDSLTTCPVCAGVIRRVIQPTGVVFKGTGFYINDSKSSGKAAPAKASADGESGDAPAEKAKDGAEKKDTAGTSDAPAKTDGASGSKPEKVAAAAPDSSSSGTNGGKTAVPTAAKRT